MPEYVSNVWHKLTNNLDKGLGIQYKTSFVFYKNFDSVSNLQKKNRKIYIYQNSEKGVRSALKKHKEVERKFFVTE